MAFWRVCSGFARFLREGSTRVDCHRMEVPRVSFAWPIWILLKTIRSLLSKDLPTACQLLVSVLSVPPAIPRLFDACRYRLFACQLANFSYHFLFAFALLPIFIRTILRDRSAFLSLISEISWCIHCHSYDFCNSLHRFHLCYLTCL